MPKVEYISITIASTGTDIVILNDSTLNIDDIILSVATASGELSSGYSDGVSTYSFSSTYGDTSTTKTVLHYRNIGGTKTKVFETVITDLDLGEFTINTTVLASPIVLKGIAREN